MIVLVPRNELVSFTIFSIVSSFTNFQFLVRIQLFYFCLSYNFLQILYHWVYLDIIASDC